MTDCQQLDGVVVLSGCESRNKSLGELVPADVPIVFSSKKNCLDRFAEVLEKFPTDAAVRIGGGDPFVDPFLVDRLVVAAFEQEKCDYVGYCSRDGQPAILSSVGVYAEWFRTSALRRAARNAVLAEDRRSPTGYIYSHPEQFSLRLIPTPDRIDREDVRLTLDIEEDWENALAIFDAIDPDEVDWQRIADLLDHQPAMRSRMAALNRQHRKV
jgi:spore coat polysaccharide biosynthesis protein SpsF